MSRTAPLAGAAPADAADAVDRVEGERRRALARGRRETALWLTVMVGVLVWSAHVSGLFGAAMAGDPLARIGVFLGRMAPDLRLETLFADRATPGSLAYWFYDGDKWLAAALETVQMAILGTVIGGVIALALCCLAARNLMPAAPVRWGLRRCFEALRTIPDIILAIVLAAAFGVGPMAGVITLVIVTVGSFGKLFTEALEAAETGPTEGVRAAGGGWLAQIRFGVAPQVAPTLVAYALLRLEINLAAAAALGIVGAGGIGIELERAITYTEFETYLAVLLIIIAMIFIIDMTSEAIRHRLIGVGAPR